VVWRKVRRSEQLGQHAAQPRRKLKRIWLLGEAGGFLKLPGALVAAFLALEDLAHPFTRDSQRGADGAKAFTRTATLDYLPIAITYHAALSIFIGVSMRSEFSARAPRTSNYLTQPRVLCVEIMSLRRHIVSLRGGNTTY